MTKPKISQALQRLAKRVALAYDAIGKPTMTSVTIPMAPHEGCPSYTDDEIREIASARPGGAYPTRFHEVLATTQDGKMRFVGTIEPQLVSTCLRLMDERDKRGPAAPRTIQCAACGKDKLFPPTGPIEFDSCMADPTLPECVVMMMYGKESDEHA